VESPLLPKAALSTIYQLLHIPRWKKGWWYFCSWGPDCDIVDEVILEDDLGERRFVGPDESAFVQTTWHAKHELDEALDFFAKFAVPPAALSRTATTG